MKMNGGFTGILYFFRLQYAAAALGALLVISTLCIRCCCRRRVKDKKMLVKTTVEQKKSLKRNMKAVDSSIATEKFHDITNRSSNFSNANEYQQHLLSRSPAGTPSPVRSTERYRTPSAKKFVTHDSSKANIGDDLIFLDISRSMDTKHSVFSGHFANSHRDIRPAEKRHIRPAEKRRNHHRRSSATAAYDTAQDDLNHTHL